jgi:hypothetical protein
MNDQTTPNPIDIISQALADLSATRSAQDLIIQDLRFLEFKAKPSEANYGKGLIFSGDGYTKQFILGANPDHFFSSETINLARERHFAIEGIPVLDSTSLGPNVTKSNLREVGRLKGLLVDGSVNINGYMFYNGAIDRLGLGTEEPNAAFSVAEGAIEVMVGTVFDTGHGMVGTFASHDFDIVTDDTTRVTVRANGNIELGNPTKNPITVTVHGKLAVGVKVPDPNVDLHVNGAVRLNNHIQMYATVPPSNGQYTVGDIVWNSSPRIGGNVGWVCIKAGDPGQWNPFGDIKESGN